MTDWPAHRLADRVAHPESRWYDALAAAPRHRFIPHWWEIDPRGWRRRSGATDPAGWMRTAYADRSVITEVSGMHADHADPAEIVEGAPSSSATKPSLSVQMYRHAHMGEGLDILDVGTGSGYGAALLCHTVGGDRVTSIDIDPYLVKAAGERLGDSGYQPKVLLADAMEELPGAFDRIVASVAMPRIPASWVQALRPGGRLVTTITGMSIIITADKLKRPRDGIAAVGVTARDWAMFMPPRPGGQQSPLWPAWVRIAEAQGDHVSHSPYPVPDVGESWELRSMLHLAVPGVDSCTSAEEDGERTTWLAAPDGSWARATQDGPGAIVHQTGRQRLWDKLDAIRHRWLREGHYPLYGAQVLITTEGECHLSRGQWKAQL